MSIELLPIYRILPLGIFKGWGLVGVTNIAPICNHEIELETWLHFIDNNKKNVIVYFLTVLPDPLLKTCCSQRLYVKKGDSWYFSCCLTPYHISWTENKTFSPFVLLFSAYNRQVEFFPILFVPLPVHQRVLVFILDSNGLPVQTSGSTGHIINLLEWRTLLWVCECNKCNIKVRKALNTNSPFNLFSWFFHILNLLCFCLVGCLLLCWLMWVGLP